MPGGSAIGGFRREGAAHPLEDGGESRERLVGLDQLVQVCGNEGWTLLRQEDQRSRGGGKTGEGETHPVEHAGEHEAERKRELVVVRGAGELRALLQHLRRLEAGAALGVVGENSSALAVEEGAHAVVAEAEEAEVPVGLGGAPVAGNVAGQEELQRLEVPVANAEHVVEAREHRRAQRSCELHERDHAGHVVAGDEPVDDLAPHVAVGELLDDLVAVEAVGARVALEDELLAVEAGNELGTVRVNEGEKSERTGENPRSWRAV